ncbi:MAG: hypothetical protein M1838_001686 [Thelocarpon superellum]|nr:MAG: hypothetical protein M1838_001686 [Thelocarpon superellum]
MIIYKDIITGDEIISDGYKIVDVDDTVYEIDSKMVKPKAENFELAGANPSAEEADDLEGGGGEDLGEPVPELAIAFELNKMDGFQKQDYKVHIKSYMKKVKAALQSKGADEAKVKAFETGAATYLKKILSNFDDYDFYTGKSMDPDGMHVMINFREDGMTPYMTVWKHALTEMKV